MKLIKWCVAGLIVVFSLKIHAQGYEQEIELFRENYKAEFLKDGHSPLKEADFKYLDFYPANEEYKVKCKFKAKSGGEPFEIPTTAGNTKTYTKFGEFSFKVNGQKQKLAVYRSMALMNNPIYRDYLFVPFKDLTNGEETYGGGRYMDLRMKELDGKKLYLDFNKAYNPYCAFSSGYACPIPPTENHLKVRIEAGEKNFLKDH